MTDRLMTAHEVAELLGVTEQSLADWRQTWPRRGDERQSWHKCLGPVFFRLGDGPKGRIRYARADLDTWLDAQRVGA